MPDLGPSKDKVDYLIHQDGPINAEPASEKLTTSWTTPISLSYMRNHGEILHIDRKTYKLAIDVEESLRDLLADDAALAHSTSVGMMEILESGRWELDAALQCAGNRREELDERAEVEGIKWSDGSVLNAKWNGEFPAGVMNACTTILTTLPVQAYFFVTSSSA